MATTEIQNSDIKEFLWLQNCIEEALFNVTLRRAIEKGRYAPEQRWLYKERVTYERYRNIDHSPEICVQYEALIGTGTFAEVFTLQEALSLCLFPQVLGKSITIEGDEE